LEFLWGWKGLRISCLPCLGEKAYGKWKTFTDESSGAKSTKCLFSLSQSVASIEANHIMRRVEIAMRGINTVFVLLILGCVGCSDISQAQIENRSAMTLSNVVVSGSGFTNVVGTLGPGAQRKVALHPRGESGLRVAFDANGRPFDTDEQGYFEGVGYRVTATINTNLEVSIAAGLDR
jgi:hypothetical protein